MAVVLLLLALLALLGSVGIVSGAGLFLFGDSLLDVGTNVYLNSSVSANFPPYGRTYFQHPTGRFSDGRNMADFIALNLGISFPLPYLDPQHNASIGVNFASAGSGILNSTGRGANVFNLRTQLGQFQTLLQQSNADAGFISNSLFVISSGGNDVMSHLGNSSRWNTSYGQVQNLTDGIGDAVQDLYDAGARKIVVLGLGPIGCLPPYLAASNSCVEVGNTAALQFNNATEQLLGNLTSSNNGLAVVLTLPYSLVAAATTERHNQYRLHHLERACCGGGRFRAQAQCGRNSTGFHMTVCNNSRSYYFWDFVHPTETSAQLMITNAWSGDLQFATPFNISTLVSIAR